jgi:hypothetical protein
MPQRASVFCNFYIRVDREALVSERALDVGSVAFKVMSTKMIFYTCQRLGGYVWCSVVRDLIVERWQTSCSVSSTLPQHILEHFYTVCPKSLETPK